MKVQWTNAAIDDLVDLRLTIAESSPQAAAEVATRILDAVDIILQYPDLGKVGRAKGTHELVIASTPYLLVYRRFRSKIQLLRVLHGRRRWPPRKKTR